MKFINSNKEIQVIGDVHGLFYDLTQLVNRPNTHSLVLGDVGIGVYPLVTIPLPPKDKWSFIRGNHDNPDVCRTHENYLGDYGYLLWRDLKIMYISGAYTFDRDGCIREEPRNKDGCTCEPTYKIDRNSRIYGKDLWEDEELPTRVWFDVLKMWAKIKPDIVISHDAPSTITPKILERSKCRVQTRTQQGLQAGYETHAPLLWLLGHYHISNVIQQEETTFVVLNELDCVLLSDLLNKES